MTLFTSSKPITPQAQTCLDQLRQLLTQCQLNGLQVHIAQLYSCGDKKSIIVMDGVEIKEDKNEKLVE
jgi:hypothetical protein